MIGIKQKLQSVRERIDAAAMRAGRSGKDVALVAVTKGASAAAIAEAREAGLMVFAENKVQEALLKIPEAGAGCQWHMIGHLQSNKVKAAVSLFEMIQSVDSVRLAEKIGEEALAAGKTMPILLEVNVSGEAQKYGFKPEAIYSAVEEVAALPGVRVSGLMGMAPFVEDASLKRESFRMLKNIFGVCKSLKRENVEMKHLSMGMSDDFEIAVEEGSNMVRLGRILFR